MNTGYAVYDLTLTRFVTAVAKTKDQAEALLPEDKRAEGHEYETRKV